ncbi:hypothetical protein [Sulfuricurvum sp.]|uniref:hypothetical protein n=1 Tax=Sulfuricurvum sp. TaxID=2025608 RepID=UPI003BB75E32
MKKWILGLLILSSGAMADFEVKINTKALYRDSFEKLSLNQQNYILDNMDKIQSITEATLKKETLNLKKEKFIDDKNVAELILNTDGSIKGIEFIARSNERRFDNITKKVLEEAVKNYPKPNEPTPIRIIFEYKIGKMSIGSQRGNDQAKATGEYIQNLQKGTTRFNHSMNQQIREFETSNDGFINANLNPTYCGTIKLLSENNQEISNGTYSSYAINKEVPKGKYKLLVQTKETCNINIQYP